MNKQIHLCITLLVSLVLLIPALFADEADIIEVRGHFNYPPYEYLGETGSPVGFDVDIITEVARVMNLNINLELGPWDEVTADLKSGNIDVLMGVYYTPARDTVYDFSIPYETVSYSLFVNRNSQIKELRDLTGKSIVLVSGGISLGFIESQNLSASINLVNSAEDALRLLAAGMYDCTILPKRLGQYSLEKHGFINIKPVGSLLLPRNLGFAVSEGNEDLLNILNQGIRSLKNSGIYERKHQEWLEVYDENQMVARRFLQLAIWVGIILILLFMLSVAGIAVLKRQVDEKTKHLQEEIKERQRVENALHQANQIQDVVYRIANAARSSGNLDELYRVIQINLSGIIDTSNFYIALIDEEKQEITFPLFVDDRDPNPGPISVDSGITGYLIKQKKPLFFSKDQIENLREEMKIDLIGVPSKLWLGAPLLLADKVIGAVVVQSYEDENLYSEKDLEVLEFVSNEIADAINSKQVTEKIIKSEEKYRILSTQLTEANGMKELLLDVITHDLKNPAGVVYGMSEMLIDEDPENEELELINQSCSNLLKVIENAALLSKVTLGDEITRNKIDIAEIIRSTANDYKSIITESDMIFDFDNDKPIIVNANPIIAEVFKNYISNAIKYSADGKKIKVEIVDDGQFVTINYLDYGPTIPAEKRPLVFDRGVRLEPGAKRGRGLGLAIVKRIAEAHDSEVGVLPNEPQGNVFYLKMPAA